VGAVKNVRTPVTLCDGVGSRRSPVSPGPPAVAAILKLQRQVGNAAVASLLRPPTPRTVQRVILNANGEKYKQVSRALWWSGLNQTQRRQIEQLQDNRDEEISYAEALVRVGAGPAPTRGTKRRGVEPDAGSRRRSPAPSRLQKRRRTLNEDEGVEAADRDEGDVEHEGEGDVEHEGEGHVEFVPAAQVEPADLAKWKSAARRQYFLRKLQDPPGEGDRLASAGISCWNWVLTAMAGDGLDPDKTFAFLHSGSPADLQALGTDIRGDLVDSLRDLHRQMKAAGLAIKMAMITDQTAKEQVRRQAKVREFVEKAVMLLILANGFEVVHKSKTNTKIVAQYTKSSGVSVDHWWLDIDGVTIQTVPNVSFIQVGNYRTHPEEVEGGEMVNVEIPIRAAKQAHVDFLRKRMKENPKPQSHAPDGTIFY